MNSTVNWLHFNSTAGKFASESGARALFRATGIVVYSRKRPVYDSILLVVVCAEHDKTLLQVYKTPYHFVPFFPFKSGGSWKDQIAQCIDQLFQGASFNADRSAVQSSLHQVTQLVVPRYRDVLHQLVLYIDVSRHCDGQCSTAARPPYKWYDLEEITVNNNELWGPEPFLYLINAHQPTRLTELSVDAELKQSTKKWSLMTSIGYTNYDLETFFSEYLQHCFPSKCMNQVMLQKYLLYTQINLTVNSKVHNQSRLYAACCITTGTYITFKNLVFALVCLERRCQHGGIGGELRTRCIFRFYTRQGASEMNQSELVTLFDDAANRHRNSQPVGHDPQKMADKLFKRLSLDPEATISIDKFVNLVGSMAIRGTASLFRATTSPLNELRRKQLYDALWSAVEETEIDRLLPGKQLPQLKRRQCRGCAKAKYSLAVHSMVVDSDKNNLAYVKEQPSEALSRLPNLLREHSLEMINSTSAANLLREVLRSFSTQVYDIPRKCTEERAIKWERKEDRFSLADPILKLCLEAREVYRKCSRVAKCTSPAYVFGDIHGNLKDLMIYDHLLWRMAPTGYVANAMFMGDYVDRGDCSLECVLYLLATKLLLPDRLHLLRGNHEIRYIQDQFTFHQECVMKFGVTGGEQIWEAVNQVFDSMPLCGLVDEQIFCAHGGIPATNNRLEPLYSIPNPLNNPLLSKSAWEILWNDPASREEYQAALALLPQESANWFPSSGLPPHYMPNSKRGTAFFYGEDAIDAFLEQNGLTCILRAHEVMMEGFQFHHNGKALTIFSSSNYCSSGNQAALVFINGGKLRVIKVETNQV